MKEKTTSKPAPKTKSAPESKPEKKSSPNGNGSKKDLLVVGLGASAGGVKALQEFFATMPPNSGMAFVVILHLSPEHESNLAEIIQSQTAMPVIKVTETHKVEPNHIYVIPPNKNLEMVDGVVRCTELKGERGERVAINVFFRTLAEEYGENAVCVILSGTGTDGTLGLKAVKEANGFAIVQDPTDAEHDGMPRSAIGTQQIVDWILPVRQMPERLIQFRDSSERLHLTEDDGDGKSDGKIAKEINADESLREILTVLRVRTGHDFSRYKTPTLIRRIARHLQIHDLEDIPAYLEFLREHPSEIQSLLKNLLINVTNFFRDREAWKALEREVVPQLFAGKKSGDTVRVWSCGCASGEEAYSLGMILYEYAERLPDAPKIQIFATDVDEDAIAEAREHRYPQSIEADVSPERLRRFFVNEGKYYRVRKELRESVLFAPHSVLRDPPFSKLDLITCRNLLIYLNRETQERVMEIFHFALASGGYLFLGSSESAESTPPLFAPIDKKHRIYSRRSLLNVQPIAPPKMPVVRRWEVKTPEFRAKKRDIASSLGEIHYKLLEKFATPSALVNREFDILYLSESAGRFLSFKGGEPSNNLLKLVPPDLLPDLRSALFTASREKKAVEFDDIRALINGKETSVNIVVRSVEIDGNANDYLLVIFDENKKFDSSAENKNAEKQWLKQRDEATESVITRLEAELARTKEHLRATIEQHEVAIEELKASNEELQAINEELRSTTEELETSKEEMQSVNEELTTVNHELKEKIEEATRTNSDLQNLMASTDIATIFLDRSFRIKLYTPPVERIFNITHVDIGRPLEHFTHRLDYENLTRDAAEVSRKLTPLEREIQDVEDRTFLARFVPYRTTDDRIEGVVLNFLDITERKAVEEELRKAHERTKAILESTTDCFYSLDRDFRLTYVNPQAEAYFGMRKEEMLGRRYDELLPKTRGTEVFKRQQKAFEKQKPDHLELISPTTGKWIDLYVYPNEWGLSVFFRDITERKAAEEALRKSEEHLNLILESTKDYAIITYNLEGRIRRWNAGAEATFGYTEEEAVGQTMHLIFTPEDIAAKVPEKEMAKALETGRAEDDRWHSRKDGTRFFASGVMEVLHNAETEGFVKICRDQTERLKAETALRDKEMLAQLVSTQEDERRRIAREIHDHLGQQLTVLRLKLEQVRKQCEDEKICDEIEKVQEITEKLDKEVDFLAWELRPTALDDLGLRVTLGNFVQEWSHHTGIKAEFQATGLAKTRLPFEIETNLYRIAQEALNNVFKHSKAQNVSVLLEKRKDTVSLIVEDGVGFNPNDKRNRGKGIGLIGMSERAKICGGNLEIESSKGKGTTVFVRVPFSNGSKEKSKDE